MTINFCNVGKRRNNFTEAETKKVLYTVYVSDIDTQELSPGGGRGGTPENTHFAQFYGNFTTFARFWLDGHIIRQII